MKAEQRNPVRQTHSDDLIAHQLPLEGVMICHPDDFQCVSAVRVLQDLGAGVCHLPLARFGEANPGAEVLAAACAGADILMIDGDAALMVDLDGVAQRLPGLIILAVTPFGITSAFRDWKLTAPVALALSGVLSKSGLPGREPLLPPLEIALECGGIQAATAALLALAARREAGGAIIDLSLFEAVCESIDPMFGIGGSASGGMMPGTEGRGRPNAGMRYPIFRCSDGFVRICLLNPRHWHGMFAWMGSPAEFASPDYERIVTRFQNWPQLEARIADLFAASTQDELVAQGQRRGVPIDAIMSMDDVLHSEHFIARSAFVSSVEDGQPLSNGMLEIDGFRVQRSVATPRSSLPDKDVAAQARPADARPIRPLRGLRVLDLGVIVVGADTGRILADFGADVIKVESRSNPDGVRQVADGSLISPSFARGHRNKRSLGLNLREAAGRNLFMKLLADADILLSNFKPGTLAALGLDYDQLRAVNPRLICVESSAYGASGPRSRLMGYGPLVRAATGITSLWRYPDDAAGFGDGSTVYPDHVAARIGALSALALLRRRDITGMGGIASVAQAEVILNQFSTRFGQSIGSEFASNTVYRCAGDDEWCVISLGSKSDWRKLAAVIGSVNPISATKQLLENPSQALLKALEYWTSIRAPDAVMRELQAAGIACGAMHRRDDLARFLIETGRRCLTTMDQPQLAIPLRVHVSSFNCDSLAQPDLRPAPLQGEHTTEIAQELLALDAAEIAALVENNILQPYEPKAA